MSTAPDEFYSQNVYASPRYQWNETPVAANARGLMWLLFSFGGRSRRVDYWMVTVLALVAYVAVTVAIASTGVPNERSSSLGVFELAMMGLFVWVNLAAQAKRWHDRNKSASWILIGMIPIIGPIWKFVELGLLPGTPGDNDYGPDPFMHQSEQT